MPSKKKKGRCSRCRKKGHVAAHCRSKKADNVSGLSGLPCELLSLIASDLIDWPWTCEDRARMCGLFSLRLTCRAIYQKTGEVFAKAAFSSISVHLDNRGIDRLKGISQRPILAQKVHHIMLSQYDKIGEEELKAAEVKASNSELDRRDLRDAKSLMRKAHLEQDDKDFINRSGTASIMLAAAFEHLTNLQMITLSCVVGQRYTRFDATRAFSIISACLPFAKARLQKLQIEWWEASSCRGISLQALCMPRHSLDCFSELQTLSILLSTNDGKRYRNPEKWKTSASNFLQNCPHLRKLSLGCSDDWEETAAVFSNIAKEAIFPQLKEFSLDFLRCQGEDLLLFLSNHENLHFLTLKNLDINGHVTYKDIFEHLQHHHSRLETFKSSQIAQDSFRTFFEKHGEIEFEPFYEVSDFFEDFVDVIGPCKYNGVAEAWEGVQDKIGVLKNDLRISERTYHSDLARYGMDDYGWLD